MKSIEVKTSRDEYEILIGKDIVSCLSDYTKDYDKILILSNKDIGDLYFEKIRNSFSKESPIYFYTIPEGERYKTLETVTEIYNYLIENNFSRKSVVISLGGGVICDIGGYCSATYMRGIDFIQVPTSLLAQVDASIGGKTAVDHPKGKNLIGVFKQPKLVVIDIEFLKTLSQKQFSSGMGEIIKHSLLIYPEDRSYFQFLKEHYEEILALNTQSVFKIIEKSCEIKRDVVQKDEFEMGERVLLNLGHTYGHGLEKLFNFENITHGEAVAKGIIFELELSKILNGIDEKFIEEVKAVFKSYKLNPEPIYYPAEELISTLKKDKKNSFDRINFILFNKNLQVYKEIIDTEVILKVNDNFKQRYIKGIIDIGTNSCRLFLAQIYENDSKIFIEKEILKDVEIVKLGEDVNKNHFLKEEAIGRTLRCLEKYREKSKKYGVKNLLAFATSATRDSKNREDFLSRVRNLDIDIKCICGEDEAKLNFLGNSLVFKDRILVVDIGGGSTEFTLGQGKNIEFIKSIDMGAVRVTEKFFSGDNYSPESIERCRAWIENMCEPIKYLTNEKFKLVGVAGTATTQISVLKKMEIYNSKEVHLSTIKYEDLKKNFELFISKNLEERKKIVGLEKKRADVIIGGTLILITLMEILNYKELVVSESDNLNGAMITKKL